MSDTRRKAEEALAELERIAATTPGNAWHEPGVRTVVRAVSEFFRALLAETAPAPSDAAVREAAEEMRASLRMRESQSWCGRVACDEVRSKGWTLLAALSSPAAPTKDEVREAAEAVSQTYYQIAAEAIGEDKVKAEFSRRFEERLAKRRDAARGGE